ncbi:MAG: hypothetical protein HYV60_10890 [Planctomycetia bacterium]|nr:hypothetical protein [Planctomycetia bacterium]
MTFLNFRRPIHRVVCNSAAADCICQQLTTRLTGQRPSDQYLRSVTELGGAIADGGFASIAGLEPEEVLMPYQYE